MSILRHAHGMVENTYDSIEAALRALIVDDESAAEIYSALYDVAWVSLGSAATDYGSAVDAAVDSGEPCFRWGWRAAGDFVAEARGRGEGYIDVYMELDVRAAEVSERVRLLMQSLGLRPVS